MVQNLMKAVMKVAHNESRQVRKLTYYCLRLIAVCFICKNIFAARNHGLNIGLLSLRRLTCCDTRKEITACYFTPKDVLAMRTLHNVAYFPLVLMHMKYEV